jgi:hypothetical protein
VQGALDCLANHPPTGSRTINLDRHACVHRVLPSRQLVRHIRTGKFSASPWPRGSRAPYAHRVATARELAGLTVVRRLLHLGGDGVSALRNLRADQAPGLLGGRRAASQLGEGPALSEAGPERRLVRYKGTPEECRQALEEHGDWVTGVLEGLRS